MLRHRSMDGDYAVPMHQGVKGAYIAVAYDPLGIVAQRQPVELFKKMHGPVSSTRTKYGLYRRIENSLPEIRQTLGGGAAVGAPASEGVGHHERLIPLVLQHLHGLIYKFGLDDARGRKDGNPVTFFKRLRYYQRFLVILHRQLTITLKPASRTRDAMRSSSSRSTLTRACSGVRRSME